MTDYRAFISYSHADRKLATRLHRRLEGYRPPRAIRAAFENREEADWRLRPIFLDREELATAGELSDSIQEALQRSGALIVICSPAAVASRWVGEEIRYFRQVYPERPVFAFVAAGDPSLDPFEEPGRAAFPPNLLLVDPDDPQGSRREPLAADARKDADGFSAAFLKLAAGLLGVRFDQLRQRELRRQKWRWAAVTALSSVLSLAFAVIAWQAVLARQDAEAARERAEIRLITERETRDFLLSVFRLADPSEARGNRITVREVLDQAVARIGRTEFTNPLIEAKFLATMAQAYANLGLHQESIELFEASTAALAGATPRDEAVQQEVVNQVLLADVQYAMGDYEPALQGLERLEAAPWVDRLLPLEQIQALNIRGDILYQLERDAEAQAQYDRALVLLETISLPRTQDVSSRSRSLGGLAQLAFIAGEHGEAERLFREAVALLLPVFGENHPDSIWALTSLGSAAYANANAQLAQSTWNRMLQVALQVYDEDHPEVATLRNSLGLLAMEQGRFEDARLDFEDAIRIDRLRRTERFDDLVYPLSNLALVATFEGRLAEAEGLLAEAQEIAVEQSHRWLGPILSRRADVACLGGSASEGVARAREAVEASVAEFGPEDWRVRQAQLTELFCRSVAGTQVSTEEADAALAAVVERWGYANCYSQRAVEQALAIHAASGNSRRVSELRELSLGWLR
jgi:tetratricopeptide (TPR) repeat protein